MENENKEISKIKIDDQVYDIKDLFVREKLRELLGDPKIEEEKPSNSEDN